jgi:hypothetical protein
MSRAAIPEGLTRRPLTLEDAQRSTRCWWLRKWQTSGASSE